MKFICRVFLLFALSTLALGTNANAQAVSGNQERIEEGKYTILNNMHGNPSALQTSWAWRSGQYWGWGSWFNKTDWNTFNVPSAVLGWHWSTPDSDTQLPAIVWNNDPVMSRARWQLTGDSYRNLNVGYTLWFHDRAQQNDGLDWRDTPKVRLAIWLHDEGGLVPEGTWQTNVWIQGEQWQVWRRTGGNWDTITFRANRGPVNNTEMRLRDFIHYVVFARGWMNNDKILSGVEFGSEVMYAEATMLQVDNFYIDVDPDNVDPIPDPDPEPEPDRDTMYVNGRHLYSPSGEKVILRGVNEGFAWMQRGDRGFVMGEIAKSNANCVRIVWQDWPWLTINDLDQVITLCIDNKMIPMLEMHDATGDLDKVSQVVDFLTRDDVVQVLNKHKKWLILNIANEAGAFNEPDWKFNSVYQNAITRIRNKGVKVPLVIDASDYGKDYQQIFRTWRGLRDHDPETNVMFSVHTYWVGSWQSRLDIYDEIVNRVQADNIPLHFGEGPQPTGYDCTNSPYQYGLRRLEESEIGWLAWSWGFMPNGDCGGGRNQFDITSDGRYGNWNTDYGRNLIVNDPNSLQNTSVRPVGLR